MPVVYFRGLCNFTASLLGDMVRLGTNAWKQEWLNCRSNVCLFIYQNVTYNIHSKLHNATGRTDRRMYRTKLCLPLFWRLNFIFTPTRLWNSDHTELTINDAALTLLVWTSGNAEKSLQSRRWRRRRLNLAAAAGGRGNDPVKQRVGGRGWERLSDWGWCELRSRRRDFKCDRPTDWRTDGRGGGLSLSRRGTQQGLCNDSCSAFENLYFTRMNIR